MKEVIRSADPRVAALIDRQATQYRDRDQLGLDRIAALLDRLGRPQDRLPPVFHVAGTNGKGSTCAFLRAALEAAGQRVHAFTSPHLVRYNERIRIAGKLIDDERLAELMGRVLDANDEIGASLFEVNTAVAFLAFAETPADACILEVGLGGRLDATNVIERPLVCGIASLGLDHQAFLGNTMVDVAAEKAGIAKRGVPLVTQLYPPAIADRIGEIAREAGAHLGAARAALGRHRPPGQAPLSRPAGRARPAPAPPARQASGAERRAGGRDAAPSVGDRRAAVGAERGDGLGQLAGAAAAAHGGPLFDMLPKRQRAVGRRRPQSQRRAAGRRLCQASIGTTACRWCCCSPA